MKNNIIHLTVGEDNSGLPRVTAEELRIKSRETYMQWLGREGETKTLYALSRLLNAESLDVSTHSSLGQVVARIKGVGEKLGVIKESYLPLLNINEVHCDTDTDGDLILTYPLSKDSIDYIGTKNNSSLVTAELKSVPERYFPGDKSGFVVSLTCDGYSRRVEVEYAVNPDSVHKHEGEYRSLEVYGVSDKAELRSNAGLTQDNLSMSTFYVKSTDRRTVVLGASSRNEQRLAVVSRGLFTPSGTGNLLGSSTFLHVLEHTFAGRRVMHKLMSCHSSDNDFGEELPAPLDIATVALNEIGISEAVNAVLVRSLPDVAAPSDDAVHKLILAQQSVSNTFNRMELQLDAMNVSLVNDSTNNDIVNEVFRVIAERLRRRSNLPFCHTVFTANAAAAWFEQSVSEQTLQMLTFFAGMLTGEHALKGEVAVVRINAEGLVLTPSEDCETLITSGGEGTDLDVECIYAAGKELGVSGAYVDLVPRDYADTSNLEPMDVSIAVPNTAVVESTQVSPITSEVRPRKTLVIASRSDAKRLVNEGCEDLLCTTSMVSWLYSVVRKGTAEPWDDVEIDTKVLLAEFLDTQDFNDIVRTQFNAFVEDKYPGITARMNAEGGVRCAASISVVSRISDVSIEVEVL